MQNLINAIAKTAGPETLADLLNCLIMAEDAQDVTEAEWRAAEDAVAQLGRVLEANVGEAEAQRLIHGTI